MADARQNLSPAFVRRRVGSVGGKGSGLDGPAGTARAGERRTYDAARPCELLTIPMTP